MRIPSKRRYPLTLGLLAGLFSLAEAGEASAGPGTFVRVSPRDPRYFELSDGTAYIPNGLNMIAPPGRDFAGMETWIRKLAANRGNFIRIWMGHPYFDVEHTESGVYDEAKAQRIAELLDVARHHGIRVKMCIESFRHFGTRRQTWSAKPLHWVKNGGPAKDIADFFDGERSRTQFKRKLGWLRGRFGDDPAVFGWELWNEVNAVAGGDVMAWTEIMLAELGRLFPHNLCMQSLGSYDHERKRAPYRRHSLMAGNDIAQVHRYLDLGAQLEVCKGPVDILAADAVRDLRAFEPGRPILLAEAGAVEPSHTGPFELYAKDRAGMILHDVIFAPFFVGAAGPGHSWHWGQYVDANDLWWHFDRFAEATASLDPGAERFEPFMVEDERLRLYGLAGERTALIWCRDTKNTWMAELRDGRPAEAIVDATITLPVKIPLPEGVAVDAYNPWTNAWTRHEPKGREIPLPPFARSLVLRFRTRGAGAETE